MNLGTPNVEALGDRISNESAKAVYPHCVFDVVKQKYGVERFLTDPFKTSEKLNCM